MGIDLQSEHERYLAEEHFQNQFSLLIIQRYKSFLYELNEDGKTVRAMDLLAPELEKY